MIGFAARRLAAMALVLAAVSVVTFLIFNVIPNGDPAARMAGRAPAPQEVAAIRAEWGFDRPVHVQYLSMMEKVATGDLISYRTRTNVLEEIGRRAPRTLALVFGAAVLWLAIGIGLGLAGALRAGRRGDRVITALALLGVSLPAFWLGALASHYLGFRLGIFPNGGYVPLAESPWGWVHHLLLPWLTLALLAGGIYARVLRTGLLETMGEEHVRLARAKGLSERRVLTGHVLRNSLIPIVSLWGLDVGALLGGGSILIEKVFDIQGVGQYAADAVFELDVPPVMAVTLLGATMIVVLSALVDILYAWLDPRIRTRR